jgi:hypothetical protein
MNSSNKTTQDKTNKKTTANETTNQRQMDQLRLFTLKYDLLKIPVDLQAAIAAGQWLKEQLKVMKLRMCRNVYGREQRYPPNLRMFRLGTRMPPVSRTEGQCLVPLKTVIKTMHRSNDA